jgi:hypothetical protein
MAVVGPAGVPPGVTGVTRGQRIEVEILSTDLVDLSVQCRLIAIIEEVDVLEDDTEDEDAAVDAASSAEAGVSALDVETASAEASVADPASP